MRAASWALLAMAALLQCGAPAEAAKQLLVLAAPHSRGYYAEVYERIIDFQARFALTVAGRDDVLILTDDTSHSRYVAKGVPGELLVRNALQADIWMRDFTTVNPYAPVQVGYAPAAQGGSGRDARYVQKTFNKLMRQKGLSYAHHDYVLDGGNVVDNHAGRVVVTDRFLADNRLSRAEAKAVLRDVLQAEQVAIIPADDPELAHADGMVMWAAADTLVVNDYSTIDPDLRSAVFAELDAAFGPAVTVVEVPVAFKDDAYDRRFSSATGINVNSVTTEGYIYMPTFGMPHDEEARRRVARATSKQVVTIDARGVSPMGGSCRCLTWQLGGAAAARVMRSLGPALAEEV